MVVAMAFAVSTGLRDAGFHALTENLALELRKDGQQPGPLNLSLFVEGQSGQKHLTNSPFLALLAMAGSSAARKISSACWHAVC